MGSGGVGKFGSRGSGLPSVHIKYEIKPHYKLFPFKWYDVIEEKWETDGTYVPMMTTKKIQERVNLKTAVGMRKLMKPT